MEDRQPEPLPVPEPLPEQPEEWYYLIDERYKEIRQELVRLSEQTTASIKSESDYWEAYHRRRQD